MAVGDYEKLLDNLLEVGIESDDRTGVGTLKTFGAIWRHNMAEGFPLITTKYVPLRLVFEELKWFLRGETSAKELQDRKVHIWDEWATEEQCAKYGRKAGDLGPVYGWQWRRFGAAYPDGSGKSFDQLAYVINQIRMNPTSRRIICSAWNPLQINEVELPACHTLWQVQVQDNVLNLHVFCRSIDCFLGLPFDIASYALLLSMLSHVTKKRAGELLFSITDLHLYKNHIAAAHKQIARTPYLWPSLSIASKLQRRDKVQQLLEIEYDDLTLSGYSHHPRIAAPVAV